MKHNSIAVYPVSVFNGESESFCFIELERILENHSFLGNPHRRSFYMLLFIVHGEGSLTIDETSIRLDYPKIIFIKPNSVFSMDINRMAKGAVICFTEGFFSLRYNDNVLQQFGFIRNITVPYLRLTNSKYRRWHVIFELIKTEISTRQKGSFQVLRSYINILLFDFDRWLYPADKEAYFSNKEEKLLQFERLLEAGYAKHKTPSFYAGQLNITCNYLNKLCKKYKGITSGELIRKRVVLEAERLLYHTAQSVSEVAYALGFDSPSYFVTFFKKSTGNTPESYRKECR
ncbi:MAG TPA: AraC family transcriptional regulator [Arachidicoccus sp.]